MKLLKLGLIALEPLIITSVSSEGMAHSCLSHIPGSMLLGAYASAWIKKNPGVVPDDSPVFRKLFLDGSVSWGNALPLCDKNPAIPVPLCLMREKNMAGLPIAGQKIPEDPPAVFNPLPLQKKENLADEYSNFLKRRDGKPPESSCGEESSPPKFKKLQAAFMDPLSLRQPDLRQVWNARVALGEKRSARKGMLFGFAALARGAAFQAEIFCDESCAAELAALVETVSSIHIGHSRSSGYGRASVKATWENAPSAPQIESDVFNLLLLSHYFPAPPWGDPLEMFTGALALIAGSKPEVEKLYLAWEQLEGFNFHWRAWRNSRKGIAQGSVLRLRFPQKTALPQTFALGASQEEGFGRILVNPPLLEKRVIRATTAIIPGKGQKPAPPPNLNNPQWRILRERALGRLAEAQARHWLADKLWLEFLKDAEALATPSASQRANALATDVTTFREMLKKTPGKQWQAAIAASPFLKGQKDHLSEIMLILLDCGKFLREWKMLKKEDFLVEPLIMPGGDMAKEERQIFQELSWKLFKREIIRSWSKMSRARQHGAKEE